MVFNRTLKVDIIRTINTTLLCEGVVYVISRNNVKIKQRIHNYAC